jgi:hypothetical protein
VADAVADAKGEAAREKEDVEAKEEDEEAVEAAEAKDGDIEEGREGVGVVEDKGWRGGAGADADRESEALSSGAGAEAADSEKEALSSISIAMSAKSPSVGFVGANSPSTFVTSMRNLGTSQIG